jgi:hypothetical protein
MISLFFAGECNFLVFLSGLNPGMRMLYKFHLTVPRYVMVWNGNSFSKWGNKGVSPGNNTIQTLFIKWNGRLIDYAVLNWTLERTEIVISDTFSMSAPWNIEISGVYLRIIFLDFLYAVLMNQYICSQCFYKWNAQGVSKRALQHWTLI